jgi:hypothetical protein
VSDPDEPAPPPAAPADPPAVDITLEEWIAAGQACCGVEPEDDEEPA